MNAKYAIFGMSMVSFFLLTAAEARAEDIVTILRGVTVLQNSNGATLENVEITVAFFKCVGENPTFSDEYGLFQFDILGKKPGEKFELKVKKEGFEVVNQDRLIDYLRNDPDDLVRIVMCPVGERDRIAAHLYNIVVENVRAQDVDSKTADAVFALAQEFTKTLAEKNLDDMSPLYRQAFDLFQQGKMAEAQDVLKDAEMLEDLHNKEETYRKAQEKVRQLENAGQPNPPQSEMLSPYPLIAAAGELVAIIGVSAEEDAELRAAQEAERRAKDELRKSVENYMLKARLCVTDLQFDDAEKYYRIATDADPENFDNLHEFALYLHKQNQFLTARPLYEKALTLAKEENNVAITLNNLGNLYADLNDYAKAADAYEHALTIHEELVAANPQIYHPDVVAMTLDNLGLLYQDLNEYDKAAVAYERARNIYEVLVAMNPQTYRPYVAATLNNLGNLYLDVNDYDKAIDAYKRALQIREEFAAANPQTYLPDVALTLNNLGLLYNDLNEYEKAADAYERALAIREELAAANPQTYRPYVAMTLNNLGVLYSNQNAYDKAADAYDGALAIYTKLAAANPQTYRPDVAGTLNNLGLLYSDLNDYAKAADAYERARAIYKKLAAANPQAYELDLCMTLLNLSYLHQMLYERDPQPTYKTEGLALAERAIGILQHYPNIPRAQKYLKDANDRKAFFEQAGK